MKALPEIRMPIDDELRAAAATWLATIRPFLYTHWPERYRELSFHTAVVELSPEETQRLIDTFDGAPLSQPDDAELLRKIRHGLARFDTGAFFKLESRSPKDNYWGEATNYRACSWHDMDKLLWSERILDDLVRFLHAEEPLRLLFREWHPIFKHQEFRCFIRGRKLAGISQYHYADWDEWKGKTKPLAFLELVYRREDLHAALLDYVKAEIIPHLPAQDLVADLWRDHAGKITLIEINPYSMSDPCLFTYDELETAGAEFRVVPAMP